MERLFGFFRKKENTVVNLNESQIALLREEAESFLATEDGQRALRELDALNWLQHGGWFMPVNVHEPKHLQYLNTDYVRRRRRNKFIVTDYRYTFYVTGEDYLITSGRSFRHKQELEKILDKKIPDFHNRLMAKSIRAIDGATVSIRDTNIKFFVLANTTGGYQEETLKEAKEGLEKRDYLLLSMEEDKKWKQTQLQKTEYKEYADYQELEWWDKKRDDYDIENMKRPEKRYNWELI